MSSSSLEALATVTASTKRAAIASGKRGTPTTHLEYLAITPLDPVEPELQNRLHLDTPHELLQCFAPGDSDVKEGDVLVVDDVEYPVRRAAYWASGTRSGGEFTHLVVEDLRK